MPWTFGNPYGNAATFGTPPHIQTDPSVAPLADAIAKLKYQQTQDVQKTLAQSIQEMAKERAANAALETAGATEGLPAPGSLEGMGSAGYALYGGKKGLAELVQDQQDATIRENLNNSLIQERTRGTGSPTEWWDSQGNLHVIGPHGGVSAAVKTPDTAGTDVSDVDKELKATTGGYGYHDIDTGQQTPNPDGSLSVQVPKKVKSKISGQFEPGVQLPDGTVIAQTDYNSRKAGGQIPDTGPGSVNPATEVVTIPPDMRSRYEKTKRQPSSGTGGGGGMSQDSQAVDWARRNPNDPRSAAILKANGM